MACAGFWRSLGLSALDQPTLEEAVLDACQRHGEDWPRGLGTSLGERYGVSRQAVASHKKSALKRIEEAD